MEHGEAVERMGVCGDGVLSRWAGWRVMQLYLQGLSTI